MSNHFAFYLKDSNPTYPILLSYLSFFLSLLHILLYHSNHTRAHTYKTTPFSHLLPYKAHHRFLPNLLPPAPPPLALEFLFLIFSARKLAWAVALIIFFFTFCTMPSFPFPFPLPLSSLAFVISMACCASFFFSNLRGRFAAVFSLSVSMSSSLSSLSVSPAAAAAAAATSAQKGFFVVADFANNPRCACGRLEGTEMPFELVCL